MPDLEIAAVGFATPAEALASVLPLREKLARVAGKTPSTVLDAFLPDPIDLAGLELKPVTLRAWLFLDKIGSPFVRGQADDGDDEDRLRALYVITQPAAEVGAALRAGDARFREAVDAFAGRLPPDALPQLGVKLAAHFAAEFSPRADLAREEEGSGAGPKTGGVLGNGAGSWLTLLDCLLSEYALPLDLGPGVPGSVLEMPVREALCLHTVIALRHGWTWAGPSYAMRDLSGRADPQNEAKVVVTEAPQTPGLRESRHIAKAIEECHRVLQQVKLGLETAAATERAANYAE